MLFSKIILALVLFVCVGAQAALSPGKFQLQPEVLTAIADKLQKECPLMYANESIEVTSLTFDYMGDENFIYYVDIVGRGYATNDPHWDMSFRVDFDMHTDVVYSLEMKNRGDCW